MPKLEKEKVRNEKYYRVGYLPKLKTYVMAVAVPWMVYYERYYKITEEEYALFDTDVKVLDKLAENSYMVMTHSDRFLFAGLLAENTREQQELYDYCFDTKE